MAVLPEVRISGPAGHRTVTVNGHSLPAVESVAISEEVSEFQRVTVTMVTNNAAVAPGRTGGDE